MPDEFLLGVKKLLARLVSNISGLRVSREKASCREVQRIFIV